MQPHHYLLILVVLIVGYVLGVKVPSIGAKVGLS